MPAADGRVHELFTQLGIEIDPQLYRLALTHRSWAFEHGGAPHNERLEFLGDAVLGVVVTEHLYRSFPDKPEGWLAKMRAAVVNTYALADVARGLGLGQALLLGKGERQTGGARARDGSGLREELLMGQLRRALLGQLLGAGDEGRVVG